MSSDAQATSDSKQKEKNEHKTIPLLSTWLCHPFEVMKEKKVLKKKKQRSAVMALKT